MVTSPSSKMLRSVTELLLPDALRYRGSLISRVEMRKAKLDILKPEDEISE
jgi:hypothetical protein